MTVQWNALKKDPQQISSPSTTLETTSFRLETPQPLIPEGSELVGGGSLVALGLAATVLGVWFLRSFLVIANPNEVVILSGRKWQNSEGQEVGFRILTGGRALRIPIVETVKRMDVTTMPVPVEVHNAYSRGGIPLHLQAIANIKISSDPQLVGNAIERFLDHKPDEIVRVARETLEGNLRGVVATMTPEQVNEDRLKFAERIASDVSSDLAKLGLQLDTLKIQNVADDVDYLKSLGRQRIAMIIRDAEIAESDALAAAKQIEAECEERGRVAQTQDRTTIVERENDLRKIKAKLDKQVRTEEAITQAAAKERKALIEQTLQALRAERERLRLQWEEVLPAEAHYQAQMLQARGEAASLAENVLAQAQVNELLTQVWQDLGSDASAMFIIQQFEAVLREAVKLPGQLDLQHVAIIDNGDGEAVASVIGVYLGVIKQFLEATEDTLGIDVLKALKST
ncbi:MAG: flotillin family protein [Leptolyngbyaceae cyanobacterium SM2_5_2]|nr:flotillin family protein [Leptolyngbyaceae cyanobacterium SM2_5_2]